MNGYVALSFRPAHRVVRSRGPQGPRRAISRVRVAQPERRYRDTGARRSALSASAATGPGAAPSAALSAPRLSAITLNKAPVPSIRSSSSLLCVPVVPRQLRSFDDDHKREVEKIHTHIL